MIIETISIFWSLIFSNPIDATGIDVAQPKRKQTKRVLRKIYYSPQSKNSISLEVAVETKLFPDSALGNSLCNSGYKTKSEKLLWVPSMPRNPQPVK